MDLRSRHSRAGPARGMTHDIDMTLMTDDTCMTQEQESGIPADVVGVGAGVLDGGVMIHICGCYMYVLHAQAHT